MPLNIRKYMDYGYLNSSFNEVAISCSYANAIPTKLPRKTDPRKGPLVHSNLSNRPVAPYGGSFSLVNALISIVALTTLYKGFV